jgi:hypothetical protein
MSAFIETHKVLYQELIGCGLDIKQKSLGLSTTVEGLVKAFDALAEL